ncbi:MAG: cupredoxin domain-containing protein [Candidatus Eremiobacteraeota bacterium]|nr:cupredoxin domain-containing protein [Candidatus Eremiobacteraeota bacterium]
MPNRSRFIVAIGCLLSVLLLSGFSCQKEHTGQVTITINDKGYSPGRIEVAEGTLVTWINNDSQPHTATAIGAFDSGPIAPGGGRWTWVAAIPGTFRYKSLMNPNMAGEITIVVMRPVSL